MKEVKILEVEKEVLKRIDKKLVPDELTKDIVVKMYDLYLEGKSYQGIVNIYNQEEILEKEYDYFD